MNWEVMAKHWSYRTVRFTEDEDSGFKIKTNKTYRGKKGNRLYYEIKKCTAASFLGAFLPDVGHTNYCCGYIYAPYKIILKIANKLNKIEEITYPSYGLAGIKEKRKKIYKVGFDTAHFHNYGTLEEAQRIINKWIKIAKKAMNEQANV